MVTVSKMVVDAFLAADLSVFARIVAYSLEGSRAGFAADKFNPVLAAMLGKDVHTIQSNASQAKNLIKNFSAQLAEIPLTSAGLKAACDWIGTEMRAGGYKLNREDVANWANSAPSEAEKAMMAAEKQKAAAARAPVHIPLDTSNSIPMRTVSEVTASQEATKPSGGISAPTAPVMEGGETIPTPETAPVPETASIALPDLANFAAIMVALETKTLSIAQWQEIANLAISKGTALAQIALTEKPLVSTKKDRKTA